MNEKVGRWRSNWEEDVEEEKRWQRKSKSIMKRFFILMVVFLHSSRQIILKCPLFVAKQLHLGTLSAQEKPKQMFDIFAKCTWSNLSRKI